jgi:hypothetical protein
VRNRFYGGTQEEWIRLAVEATSSGKDIAALFEKAADSELFWVIVTDRRFGGGVKRRLLQHFLGTWNRLNTSLPCSIL